jgi:FkbM family methyltransferase
MIRARTRLNQWVRNAFGLAGLTVHRRRTMPRGLDLFIDLERHWRNRPPGVLLDVGANQGQTSRSFAARFPSAEIHAFEPVTSTHALLAREIRALPRVRAHRMALGAEDGTTLMEAQPGSGSNRVMAAHPGMAGNPTESVPMRRLDTLGPELGLEEIALLKTDCEGHDLAVLQGAEGLLRARRIACIYCEVNFRRDGLHGDFFAIESYLHALGYRFYALYDYSSAENDVREEGFANALFIR